MRNNIHLITGFDLHPIDYHSTLKALHDNQFETTVAQTRWDDAFENLVADAQTEIDHLPGGHPIIVGHGEGGNLAAGAAAWTRRGLGGLVFASPGVMCAEAMAIPAAKAALTERFADPYQQDQIGQFSMTELANAVDLRSSQVAVLVGEREVEAHPYAGELAEITAAAFGTNVIVVPEAPHLIELSPDYIDTVVGAALRIHEAGRGL